MKKAIDVEIYSDAGEETGGGGGEERANVSFRHVSVSISGKGARAERTYYRRPEINFVE